MPVRNEFKSLKYHILFTTSISKFIHEQPHLSNFSPKSRDRYEFRILLKRHFIKSTVRKTHHITPRLELIWPCKVRSSSNYVLSRFGFKRCMYKRAGISVDINLRPKRVLSAFYND
ncbi:hypothetical protein M7I_7631 [Glarea lozoyensis 74030]|uniref:Uncharacterized protein n=1 Tax=Glarea lozoyensis (strain ATCC 74030 / MF5533) TaxID=1104152 RepID=H0EXU1_GLAL7|nr:hypothetical protein M7I_7631 [Glarea lozoyensis 74030]